MWGQGAILFAVAHGHRIIPTRVGTSLSAFLSRVPAKDHPHACGDKVLQENTTYAMLGSSPRVWGQDSGDGVFTVWERIIPTRVGTSGTSDIVGGIKEDHPHACGDKSFDFLRIQPN